MAKKSIRTNAFGMAPDSFETTRNRQEIEVNPVIVQQETPVVEVPAPAVAAPEQGKREYKKIGKDKVRVHFLMKANLLERVDDCAEAKDMARTIIIQEAIKQYLEKEGY